MTDEFYRIQRLPPYVFAEVNAMKAAARAASSFQPMTVDPLRSFIGQADARTVIG